MPQPDEPVDGLRRSMALAGGFACAAQLVAASSEKTVQRAVRQGAVLRVARGRYVLPELADPAAAAFRLLGARSHLSAAESYQWGVAWPPAQPVVTVPRGRRVPADAARGVDVRVSVLTPAEIEAGVTAPMRTVLDCAKTLPFGDGLAVADSALRSGVVTQDELLLAAHRLRGPGSKAARRVAELADPRAANPFESVLRSICHAVPGLSVVPQVEIADGDFYARVDLADERHRLVLEADSFEFHGTRKFMARDARRYNSLVARGWLVLRFTWEDVFLDPEGVRVTLLAAVAVLEALAALRS